MKKAPYDALKRASKSTNPVASIRAEISRLQTQLYKLEDAEVKKKFEHLAGKFYRLPYNNDVWMGGVATPVTTYYKFIKKDKNAKGYEVLAVVVEHNGRLNKSYNHLYSFHHLNAHYKDMTEISAVDWQFIMRDAIEQFSLHAKKELGVLEEKELNKLMKGEKYDVSKDL